MAEVAATMARLGGTVTGHVLAASAQPNAPTMQMSSLASISQAVGEVAPPSVSSKSNAPLMILLGVIGFLVLGGIAAVMGAGFFAARLVHRPGGGVTAAIGESPSGSVTVGAVAGSAVEASPGATPHCGRFSKFLVPTPPGFGVMSCVDSNGMGSLTFVGTASPHMACVPMKKWTNGLGWMLDAETAVDTTEATILHRGSQQLTVACTASAGKTMVVVSLTPRS